MFEWRTIKRWDVLTRIEAVKIQLIPPEGEAFCLGLGKWRWCPLKLRKHFENGCMDDCLFVHMDIYVCVRFPVTKSELNIHPACYHPCHSATLGTSSNCTGLQRAARKNTTTNKTAEQPRRRGGARLKHGAFNSSTICQVFLNAKYIAFS